MQWSAAAVFPVPLASMGAETGQVRELQQVYSISVTGRAAPRIVCSFAHFGFPESFMKKMRAREYLHPTAIQSQAIPVTLSGRDCPRGRPELTALDE